MAARNSHSLIDYVIVNEKMKNLVKDIQAYGGAEAGSDYYLVVSVITLLRRLRVLKKTLKRLYYQMIV